MICVYQTIPAIETQTPNNFCGDRTSSNKMTPPANIVTVFRWLTIFYVKLDVATMTRNVEILTSKPKNVLTAIARTQPAV